MVLFLLLEGIAFSLIVRRNEHQKHVVGDALMNYSAAVQEKRSELNAYFHLREDNDQLMVKNKLLEEEILRMKNLTQSYDALKGKDSVKSAFMSDTTILREDFEFIPCRVIKQSVHKNYNYMTLDKGSKQGVAVDMGVISPEGIAGRVVEVQENYSLAQSALNIDFRLTLKAVKSDGTDATGNVGFFEWRGRSASTAYLTYIPETVPLEVGNSIVTSGSSLLFPPDIRVGVISRLNTDKEGGFYNAEIKLATDFRNLRNVYLIDARHRKDVLKLEENLPIEQDE